jgi:hypothetical protein
MEPAGLESAVDGVATDPQRVELGAGDNSLLPGSPA